MYIQLRRSLYLYMELDTIISYLAEHKLQGFDWHAERRNTCYCFRSQHLSRRDKCSEISLIIAMSQDRLLPSQADELLSSD